MADYLPQATGLWTTATWITAFSNLTAFAGNPPMSADDVYADGKTITIDTNINVASLRTTTAPRTGGLAGGGFRINNNVSLTALNIIAGGSVTGTTTLIFASAAPASCNIVANFQGGVPGGFLVLNAMDVTGTGTVNISGNFTTINSAAFALTNNGTVNIYSGSIRGRGVVGGDSGSAVLNNTTGIINLTGNINGGSSNQLAKGITNNGILNVLGHVTAGSSANQQHGIENTSTGIINISGIISGAQANVDNAFGILNNGVLNVLGGLIRGTTTGGTNNAPTICSNNILNVSSNVRVLGGGGLTNAAIVANTNTTYVINISGTCIGGTAAPAVDLRHPLGTVNCFGVVVGNNANNVPGVMNSSTGGYLFVATASGAAGPGVSVTSSGIAYIRRVVGAPGGPTNPAGGTAAGLSNSQNGVAYVQEFEFGAQGASPVTGPVFIDPKPNNITITRSEFLQNFSPITFLSSLSNTGLFPAISSVRFGTTYGRGDFTGTMIVPTFSAVQVGVPVDDKIGIFVLSPESFWTFKRSEVLKFPDSIGYRIANLATIASVGETIASFNLSGNSPTY